MLSFRIPLQNENVASLVARCSNWEKEEAKTVIDSSSICFVIEDKDNDKKKEENK